MSRRLRAVASFSNARARARESARVVDREGGPQGRAFGAERGRKFLPDTIVNVAK